MECKQSRADFLRDRRDLEALATAAEKSSALAADSPGLFDFTVAGLLAGIYDQQPPTWLNELAEQHADLRDYAEAVQAKVGVWGRR